MKFKITADYTIESKIELITNELYSMHLSKSFEAKNYGTGMNFIGLVLMCQQSEINLKQRINYSKKESRIFIDIMLNYEYVLKLSFEELKTYVVRQVIKTLHEVFENKKIKEFNYNQFLADLQNWFITNKWN